MSEAPDPAAVAALIAAQRRELRDRRRWILACRFASLGFAAWYLERIIIQGLDSPFYISVNLFAILTGMSGFVAVNYFDPPLLVRHLHLGDERLRAAAWAALQPLRGEILPVIDLKKFFEVPEKELRGRNKVIVLQAGKMTFAILVDEVLGARSILATDIQSSLPTLMGIRKKYLKGITSERLAVLDAENLLMDESIVVDEQVAE